MTTRAQISGVSGASTNIHCFTDGKVLSSIFWMINGSVYGLLHVPKEFVVCSETNCNLYDLRIPAVQSEMDGYTFQCVGIDYNTNTHHLGRQTELSVTTLTSSQVESLNSKLTTHMQSILRASGLS